MVARGFLEIMHESVEMEFRKAGIKDRVSLHEVHQAVGVFLLANHHRVKTWYQENNMKTTLKKHKFDKIRGKFGKFGLETLDRMEASLCAASKRLVRPGRYLVIDELVYAWSRHTPLTVWIPRKPHPLGHLFYQLAVFVGNADGTEERPFLLSFSFVHNMAKGHQPGPVRRAKALVEEFGATGSLYVVDSAFGKPEFFDYLRSRRANFLAAVSRRQAKNLSCLESQLGDGESILLEDKRGQIHMLHYAETESDSNGHRVGHTIFSVTNAWRTKGGTKCTCPSGVDRKTAHYLLGAPLSLLQFLCRDKVNKIPGSLFPLLVGAEADVIFSLQVLLSAASAY